MTRIKIIRYVATNDRGLRIGEGHQRAKYPDALVDRICNIYYTGLVSYRELARAFNIPRGVIRDWVKGRRRGQVIAGHREVRLPQP